MALRLTALLLTFLLVFSSSNAHAQQEMEEMNIAVLRTIDKISAYTHTFEIPVDKTVQFGTSLFIRVRACRKSPPIEKPEDAAFLQIWERKPGTDQKPNWVFSGWMFSSNPSISAMDHPVYDVWVIACKNERTSESEEEFTTEASPDEEDDGASTSPAIEE